MTPSSSSVLAELGQEQGWVLQPLLRTSPWTVSATSKRLTIQEATRTLTILEPVPAKRLQDPSKSQGSDPGLEGMGKVQKPVFGGWPSRWHGTVDRILALTSERLGLE